MINKKYDIKLNTINERKTEYIKNNVPFSDYKFKFIYTLKPNAPVKNVEFNIPLPNNIKEQQYISDLNITPKPNIIEKGLYMQIVNDGIKNLTDNSDISAKFVIPYLKNDVKITIEGKVRTKTYNIKIAKKLKQNITLETQTTLQKYLQPQKNIESQDPYITSIAEKIQGKTQEEIIENIYKYIQSNMKYKGNGCIGAKQALIKGYGQCCDYAAIMVALARAKGIPARSAGGKVLNPEGNELHAWVEIYYDEYGWVTYDPSIFAIIYFGKVFNVSSNRQYLKILNNSFVDNVVEYSAYRKTHRLDVEINAQAYPIK